MLSTTGQTRFFVSDGIINYRLIPLAVIFFGISAIAFSAFRGILFLIQSILDRSQAAARDAGRQRCIREVDSGDKWH